jgi:hypothetical protein
MITVWVGFLSVDPFIRGVGNSQGLNPYSYIINNPLAGTDPSGYMVHSNDFWRRLVEQECSDQAAKDWMYKNVSLDNGDGKNSSTNADSNQNTEDLMNNSTTNKKFPVDQINENSELDKYPVDEELIKPPEVNKDIVVTPEQEKN